MSSASQEQHTRVTKQVSRVRVPSMFCVRRGCEGLERLTFRNVFIEGFRFLIQEHSDIFFNHTNQIKKRVLTLLFQIIVGVTRVCLTSSAPHSDRRDDAQSGRQSNADQDPPFHKRSGQSDTRREAAVYRKQMEESYPTG